MTKLPTIYRQSYLPFLITLYVRGAKEQVTNFSNDGMVIEPTEEQLQQMRKCFVSQHLEHYLSLSEEQKDAFLQSENTVWRMPLAKWAQCSTYPKFRTLFINTVMACTSFFSDANEINFEGFRQQLTKTYPNLSFFFRFEEDGCYDHCGFISIWNGGSFSWSHPCLKDMLAEYGKSPLMIAREHFEKFGKVEDVSLSRTNQFCP